MYFTGGFTNFQYVPAYLFIIPVYAPHGHADHKFPCAPGQRTHHSKVQETNHIPGQYQQVAGMGIRMKKTIFEDLFQLQVDTPLGNQLGIQVQFPEPILFGNLNPLNVFHDKHLPSTQLTVTGGHIYGGILTHVVSETLQI